MPDHLTRPPADHPEALQEQFKPWSQDERFLVGDLGTIIGAWVRPLAGYIDRKGYRWITTYVQGDGRAKKRAVSAHVLVCEAWNGPKPSPRHEVAHGNGVPADNRAKNLRWATPAENQADRVLHGTSNHGGRNGLSRLTDDQVLEIRALVRAGCSQRAVAARYGIGQSRVSDIMTGRAWAHVSDETNPGEGAA